MRRQSKIIVLILITIITTNSLNSTSAKAAKSGDACGEPSKTIAVGKIQLQCIGENYTYKWVEVPKVTPTFSKIPGLIKTLTNKVLNVNNQEFESNEKIELVEKQILTFDARFKDIKNLFDNSSARSASLLSEGNKLKDSLSQLRTNVSEKSKVLNLNYSEYQTAIAATNAYSSTYQAAISSRSATVSCSILATFGFGSACPSNPYQDAIDSQKIQTYNSLKSKSDAAYTAYISSYESYKQALTISQKQESLSQITLDSAEIFVKKSELDLAVLNKINEKKRLASEYLTFVAKGQKLHEEILSSIVKSEKYIAELKKSNSKNYVSKYKSAIIFVRYLEYINLDYESLLNSKPELDLTEVSSQSSDIWSPPSYLVASNYSDLAINDSNNFAWSWVASPVCATISPCTSAYVVTKNNCNSAVLELDFKTDAKGVEARTSSKPVNLKKGEIQIIEIESKFTATAKNAYVSGFKCGV